MITRDDVTHSTRFAGQVKRYHTWPTITTQTVAEHTWQVMRIYHKFFGLPTTDIWKYILYHDVAEIMTGDLPFPVKKNDPALKKKFDKMEHIAFDKLGVQLPILNSDELLMVKLCDLYEMMEFGVQEMEMGNKYAGPIVRGTAKTILELTDHVKDDIYSKLQPVRNAVWLQRIELFGGPVYD